MKFSDYTTEEILLLSADAPFKKGTQDNGEGILDRREKRMLQFIDGHSTFLEIGGSMFRPSIYLLERGKSVTMIDIDDTYFDDVIRFCKSRNYNCSGPICIDFMNYNINKKFDCVFATEVIEHVIDWRAFIGKMLSMASGCIAFTTPMGRSFWDPGHVNFFNYNDFDWLDRYGDVTVESLTTKKADEDTGQRSLLVVVNL